MQVTKSLVVAAALAVCFLLPIAKATAKETTAKVTVVPKIGVMTSAEDIERARQMALTKSWAKNEAEKIIREASHWVDLPDSWYHEMMPPQGSVFAYGQTGCPIDNTAWPNFGSGGVADFSRPLVLQCPNGHLIDIDDPTSPYYDPGPGIAIDGVRYYLRGIWNAYVTNQLAGWGSDSGAVQMLAYAYALTGDTRYAHKAMVIMDALATLSPTTIGPRDFVSSETQVQGRLHWLTSIVYRSRIHLVNAYDIVYHGVAADEPSPTFSGRSLRENIEQGLFMDYVFDHYDMRNGRLASLHNHEADSVRGMLAVGMLLGIPEYITWGIDAIAKFLDNTIDRDGLYYETSLSYSTFSQGVFLNMAELAYNYSPDNYKGSGFPAKSDFPYEANFYDHPKLQRFLIGYRERVDAAGFRPAIGNASPNLKRQYVTSRSLEPAARLALEHFVVRCSDSQLRTQFAEMLRADSAGDTDRKRSGRWLLFHAEELPEATATASDVSVEGTESALLGGTGMGYLRSGEPPNLRAALMRGGSTLPHGHDDVLGLLLYARGWDFNTEVGYGIFGTPLHLGWGSTGIAHNLVVVNKGLRRNDGKFQVGPGGDTLAFAKGQGFSGMEMDAPQMFEAVDGVSQYQRGVWQIDVDEYDSYWVDIFRVKGGYSHDYSFHAGTTLLNFEGVQPESIPEVWTLHGLDDPHASFDEPTKSWGERITPGENIKDLGVPSEGVRPGRGWTPIPGNGYGFIHDLKGGEPTGAWSATWSMVDMSITRLRLTMLPQGGAQQVYRGVGPDLSGKSKYAWAVARREAEAPLESRFVSVIQAYGVRPTVSEIIELTHRKGHSQSAALRLELRTEGRVDYVLSNPEPELQLVATDGDHELATDAMFALVRVMGDELIGLHMVGGTYLRYGPWQVQAEKVRHDGVIEQVDYDARRLLTRTPLPSQVLNGATVVITNPAYSRNTAYKVAGVSELGDGLYAIELGQAALELGRTEIERVSGDGQLALKAPLPTAFEYNTDTRALHGKQVANGRTRTSGVVQANPSMKSLRLVEPVAGWEAGDPLVILDVSTGDTFEILTQVDAEHRGDVWEIAATVEAAVEGL
jgi:hypothetical protein